MKEWVTVAEAAALIGRHPSRVYAWIDAGELRFRHGADGQFEGRATQVRSIEGQKKRGRPRGSASPSRSAR